MALTLSILAYKNQKVNAKWIHILKSKKYFKEKDHERVESKNACTKADAAAPKNLTKPTQFSL
jgi:hypothetical protein